MPSQAILEKKKQQVAELKEKLQNSVAGVLVDYKGISVADDTVLRKELREANVDYMVVKNTILHLAFEGTNLESLDNLLEGTTAIAISSEDHVAAARILGKYAEAHENFNLKGGFLDGEVIDLATVNSLAKLPSREILLATVCNAFNAPISAFARVLQAVVDNGGEAQVTEAASAEAEEAPAEVTAEAPAAE